MCLLLFIGFLVLVYSAATGSQAINENLFSPTLPSGNGASWILGMEWNDSVMLERHTSRVAFEEMYHKADS